jgi:signal transduction histidine kinase
VLERDLVSQCLRENRFVESKFADAFTVAALPVRCEGRADHAIVFGWAFRTFPTGLGCAALSRRIGAEPNPVWHEARRVAPISAHRFGIFTELLQTLVDSNVRQLQAIERLEELARLREGFLARVSHELRTPLNALSLRLQILEQSASTISESKLRESVSIMLRHVGDQSRLIEDLLEAAKTLTGKLTIHRSAVELDSVIQKARDSVESRAAEKRIRLVVKAPPGCDAIVIHADAWRLQQVFWNLLSNAIKFTPEQGDVTMELRPRADAIDVDVTDTGPGLDAEVAERIFEPFARQKDGNEDGLGLGLTIAKQVVQLHGGQIRVARTTPGEGTTFTVSLPRDDVMTPEFGSSEEVSA